MEKLYQGEVLISEANEFQGSDGSMVELWRLGLMLTDDKGITFNISKHDAALYTAASGTQVGEMICVRAYPEIRMDGRMKWKATEISVKVESTT